MNWFNLATLFCLLRKIFLLYTMSNQRIPAFDILRVVGMFFVMLIHSPMTQESSGFPAIVFLRDFLGCGAVPAFFLLSGYFSVNKIDSDKLTFSDYLKDRFHTLMIPYLFWNLLMLGIVFAIKFSGLDIAFKGQGSYLGVEFDSYQSARPCLESKGFRSSISFGFFAI